MRIAVAVAATALLIAGCGKKNPVSEVSVQQSRVKIDETAWVAGTDDWTGWRGPTSDGQVPSQTLPVTWSDDENIKWRVDLPGRGHGSPIVVDEKVIVATAMEEEEKQVVLAVDRESGDTLWTRVVHSSGFPTPPEIHKKATNANGTVASNGERLFISFLNSDAIFLTALDLDGELIWTRQVGKFVSKFGYAPSPILYKSLVIVAADNSGGGYLSALDAETGDVAWRVKRTEDSSYSSPMVATLGGKDQLLISGCNSVSSYDPATGDQNWHTECTAESTCGTIVCAGERLFASGGYPQRQTVCLSSEGSIIWQDSARIYEPSMVVVGNQLVGVSDDGVAYCWDIADGNEVWKERLGGNFSASPIVCDGRVYASNLKGDTFVFTIEEAYQEIAKNRLGEDCYASPAVSRGEIFLRIGVRREGRRTEQLVCISES